MAAQRSMGWLLLSLGVLMAALIGFGMFYINRQVAKSEMRDCATLRSDIEYFRAAPPTSRAERGQLKSKIDRYLEIGCRPELGSPR